MTKNQELKKIEHFFTRLKPSKVLLYNVPSYRENLSFFDFFVFGLKSFFLNPNSTSKVCSFKIYYIHEAQKISKWEGSNYYKFC